MPLSELLDCPPYFGLSFREHFACIQHDSPSVITSGTIVFVLSAIEENIMTSV